MSLGILSDSSLPLSYLLDAINHAEVGHLPRAQQLTATSDDGARGPYQFLPQNLHDMGYGMPRDIPLNDVLEYNSARNLAGRYVTGYSEELGFKTPLEQLVAFTAGPTFAKGWVARGANIEELGPRTQSYIKRAAAYLNENYNNEQQQQEPEMSNTTFLGMAFDPQQAAILEALGQNGNPMARAAAEQIANEQMNRKMAEAAGVAPSMIGAANAQSPNPALMQQGFGALSGGPVAASDNGPVRIQMTKQVPGMPQFGNPNAARNRRDNSAMSLARPPQGNLNDLLIAMGSAGMRGSAEGGLQSLAGMGEAYGAYQAAQQDAVAKYNQAMAKMTGKNKGGTGGSAMSGVIVNDALNRVDPLLSGWSTGIGSYLNMIPGTDAQKVKNLLATVKGNIGFDKLQAMRDASPTGGALGQVSERELSFLQSVFGSLEQDQSAEELRYNLQLLRYVYNSIIHGEGNHPYTPPTQFGSMGASAGGIQLSPEDQALVDRNRTQ